MDKKAQFEAFLAAILPSVPEDKRASVEEALRADDVIKTGGDFVLRQNDYSREQDRLRKEAEALETKRKEWTGWFEQASAEATRIASEHEKAQATLKAYEAQYGPLTDATGKRVTADKPADMMKFITEELDKRDRAGFVVMDVLSDIKLEHFQQFKEKLNTEDVLKIAHEKGVPLQTAYQDLIAPRVTERREKEIEERIAKAKSEGAAEALSKHHLPVAPSTPAASIFNPPADGVVHNDYERQSRAAANFTAAIAKATSA